MIMLSIFDCEYSCSSVLCFAFVYYLKTVFIPLFLTPHLLLNHSKVYLWRQSASGRSTCINQELQRMSSKFHFVYFFFSDFKFMCGVQK